jgi:PTH1 family peptidyl-tRNA hydrolase
MDSDNLETKEWLFVGLGNPGKKYEMTRHNMGYLAIQAFARLHDLTIKENKQLVGLTAKGEILNTGVHLVLPTTYMNESGQAVRRYLDYYKLNMTSLVVVCDDIDLPFGHLRLRKMGTAGGHNGLKSIERHLNTNRYARLRMGIGRSLNSNQILSDYVLENFTAAELEFLPSFLMQATQALQQLLTTSFSKVMNGVNVRGCFIKKF